MPSDIRLVLDSVINDKEASVCCLCFEEAGEDGFQVAQDVTLEIGREVAVESFSTILVALLGQDITTIFQYFKAVCKQCMDSAISSYKFINKTKDHHATLDKALNSLIDCLETATETEEDQYASLYIAMKQDFETEQIYDSLKQTDHKKSVLRRFEFLTSNTPKGYQRRERDYSTIFIKTHELIHDPRKPKEYRCKVCLKLYPASGSLRQHFFAAHFKKEFQCPNCPKGFGTEGLLQTHITQTHFTVACDECGKILRNRFSSLKRHAETHGRERKVCGRCGRIYKKRTDYQRHIEQKTCVPPSKAPGDYRCDKCTYHCSFKHQLAQHIKYEHTNAQAHTCRWCNRKCYSRSALQTHILKHTKEKNFVCSECGGRFVTRQSLINHMRLHTGERPYKCLHCDQSFLSASRRKEHIERKHVDTMFECDMCDAKYNARRSLVKHRKKHLQPQDGEDDF